MHERISLLTPTRNRPDNIRELLRSVVRTTAVGPVEVVFRLDDDDVESLDCIRPYAELFHWPVVVGPRKAMSDLWNDCAAAATGEILFQCADDIRFRTPGWDQIVREAFAQFPDRLAVVFGGDGNSDCADFGTHWFVHRKWIETVGYFTPSGFQWGATDVWACELGSAIGRLVHVPILTEHMHPLFGKAPWDQVYREAFEHRYPADRMYESQEMKAARAEAIGKLRAAVGAGA